MNLRRFPSGSRRSADGGVQIAYRPIRPPVLFLTAVRLDSGQWRDVEVPPEVIKEQKLVTLPASDGQRFYRLRSGCTDFSEFQLGRLPNPFDYLKTRFAVFDWNGGLIAWAAIDSVGTFQGLHMGFGLEVELGSPCLEVEATLVTFAGAPLTLMAFKADGTLAGTNLIIGTPGVAQTASVNAAGEEIVRVRIEAPQDETLLLRFCCRYELEATGDHYNPYGVAVDEVNLVNFVDFGKEIQAGEVRRYGIPSRNIYREPFQIERKPDQVDQLPPPSKISPVLLDWLATHDPREVVEILVTFPNEMPIPLLPDLGMNEDRERGVTRRGEVIRTLQEARQEAHKRILERLRQFVQGEVFEPLESFWIVNTLSLRVQLGSIPSCPSRRTWFIFSLPRGVRNRRPMATTTTMRKTGAG